MFNYINFNANKRPVNFHFFIYSVCAKIQILLQGFPQTLNVVKREVLGKIRGKLLYRSRVTTTHKVPAGNSELVLAFYVKRKGKTTVPLFYEIPFLKWQPTVID
jgi:hypothetical protein